MHSLLASENTGGREEGIEFVKHTELEVVIDHMLMIARGRKIVVTV